MDDNTDRGAVDRFWAALADGDRERAAVELSSDLVEEWPQSGERIRGIDSWLGMTTHHPAFPAIKHVRTVGRDDVWTTHASYNYAADGSAPFEVLALQECRDGKIARITEVFGAPFEAAEWRTAYVERF